MGFNRSFQHQECGIRLAVMTQWVTVRALARAITDQRSERPQQRYTGIARCIGRRGGDHTEEEQRTCGYRVLEKGAVRKPALVPAHEAFANSASCSPT